MKPFQTEVWTTVDGTDVPLTEMSASHRRNALAWCLRRAATIEADVTLAELTNLYRKVPTVVGEMPDGTPILGPSVDLMPRGDAARDAFDAMLEARAHRPREFVLGLPLVQELARLVALDTVAEDEGEAPA